MPAKKTRGKKQPPSDATVAHSRPEPAAAVPRPASRVHQLPFVFAVLAAVVLIAGVLFFALGGCSQSLPESQKPDDITVPVETFTLPLPRDSVAPTLIGTLDKKLIPECSGLAASRKYPGVFWAHSDSDNPNTIVPIRADGTVIKPANAVASWRGVTIKGAKNTDWESIAIDPRGRIVIGDVGNNHSKRRDLAFLFFDEPDPATVTEVARHQRLPVRHRDQTDFPDKKKRFDCESLFFWNGELFVLTKRWSSTWTVLCKLNTRSGDTAVLEPVTAFDANGLVTEASVSPDGRKLAVLTYHNLWLFELPPEGAAGGGNPLSGAVWYSQLSFPAENWQVEGMAFLDNQRVLIAAEQGGLFTLDLSLLKKVR